MIFADHIKGLDNRIQFQRLRAWNATVTEADKHHVATKHAQSQGLLRYDTTDDEFVGFVGEPSATDPKYDNTNTWVKLMDERLAPESIWMGPDAGSTPADGVFRARTKVLSEIKLSYWAIPDVNIDLGNKKIVNLAKPSNDNDAVNMKFVTDQIKSGGDKPMPSAVVATTASLDGVYDRVHHTLTAKTSTELTSIDSVTTLRVNDIVLVKNQGTPIPGHQSTKHPENGLYKITVLKPQWKLTRHGDMDYGNGDETAAGIVNEFNNATVVVREGSTNANTTWRQSTPYPVMDNDDIEFLLTVSGAHYEAGNGMVLAGTNVFHFGQSTNYTKGSLFVASDQHTIKQLPPGDVAPATTGNTYQYAPFVHQKAGGTEFQRSEYGLPITLLSNSILATSNTAKPNLLQPLPAPINTVLVRLATGGIVWSNKLPTGVGMPDLVPLDKGGTGADLTAGDNSSVVATDTPNVRHGLVFMMDGSTTPRQLEVTKGPDVSKDMLLMHQAQKGSSLGTADNQGKNAWEWIDLWGRDNHFSGQVKLGTSGMRTACQPALILENYIGTTTTDTASSPSIVWTTKYTSGTAKTVNWAALARANDATGSTSWELGICDASSAYHPKYELSDLGYVKMTQDYDATAGHTDKFLQICGSAARGDTIGPGKEGKSSLAFVNNHVSGQHSVVSWRLGASPGGTANPTVTIGGNTTTDLIWGGKPIPLAKGGWGKDISGLTENALIVRTSTDWATVAASLFNNAPLLNKQNGLPHWAPYSLPARFANVDTGGYLQVHDTGSVTVAKPVKGPGTSVGPARKMVKECTFTTAEQTVTHGLDTVDLTVSVREKNMTTGALKEQLYVTVELASTNSIKLKLANAPTAAHTYVVTMIG